MKECYKELLTQINIGSNMSVFILTSWKMLAQYNTLE